MNQSDIFARYFGLQNKPLPLTFLHPLFCSPVPAFPRPTICPWVSEVLPAIQSQSFCSLEWQLL